LIKPIRNKENFIDEKLYEFYEEYLCSAISSSSNILTEGSTYAKKSRIKITLCKFLKNIEVTSLNHTVLLNHINTTEFDKESLIIIVDFILFLIDRNLINDDRLTRLIYFRMRFLKMSKVEEINYVLNYSRFNDYVENNYFYNITKLKMGLFFICPNKIDYSNENSYEYVNNYLHIFKLKTDYSTASMPNNCRELLKVTKIIFNNSAPYEITFEEFRTKIKDNITTFSESGILQTLHLIKHVIKEERTKDQRLNNFIEVSEYFSKFINKEKFIELLDSESNNEYFYVEHNKRKNTESYLYRLNIENSELKEAFASFLKSSQNVGLPLNTFAKYFDKSLEEYAISSINDLNIESYVHQVRFFSRIGNSKNKHLYSITSFYNHIANNYNPNLFYNDGFNLTILHRTGLANDIADGFELISLNPYDPVPPHDKWLLFYGNMNTSNSDVSTSFIKRFDFSSVKNDSFRNWHKHYLWHNSSGISTKALNFSDIRYFLNYVDKIKRREILTIYTGSSPDENFNVNDAIAYKNHIYSIHDNNRTRSSYIYNARNLLKHVVDYELFKIDDNCFYHLTHTLSSDYNNAFAIPDDELKKISNLMLENSYGSTINALYYAIFYIALETEFRPSQIVALPLKCYQETAKPNQYVLISKTKRHSKDPIEQAITMYVKRQIDEIVQLTKEYRDLCHIEKLKEFLFIIPASKYDRYKLISVSQFNTYIQKCCKTLNLRSYSMQNLRDTHMTKAEEYAIRNSMSDLEQGVLTGHVLPETTSRSYVDTQLTELLEAVHGIIIGNIDLNGKVVNKIEPEIENAEHLVENGCGYCDLKACKETTMLGCLVCTDFVTTVSRLKYFEEQIKTIDKKLLNATLRHDKEDLINIKILLVAYKKEIMKLME